MIDRVDCPSKVRERFRQNPPFNQPAAYDRMPQREAHLGDEYVEDEQAMGEAEGQDEPLDDATELQETHGEHQEQEERGEHEAQTGELQGEAPGGLSNGMRTDEEVADERPSRY